ncbi:hypothetical protein FAP39_13985 [Shimia litoralis]|uniref:Transposase n=1 Tax=Shimia litoralis TaxID=420403 RepID=A0A4U7MWF5_9RHOB|nr:hypothetical protein FAP39_13985 [Shimia litoralis]
MRADSYERALDTKAGAVKLKMPNLRKQTFETTIIARYQRRGSAYQDVSGGASLRAWETSQRLCGGRLSVPARFAA